MFTRTKAVLVLGASIAPVLTTASAIRAGVPATALASYPLYCQGRLNMERADPSFIWTTTIAKKVAPGTGQCSWPDRVAREGEVHADAGGSVGLLCSVSAYAFAIGSFGPGRYFVINVASRPGNRIDGRPACLTPTAAPVALTPETRPWPVEKRPGDGPRPAS